MTKNMKVRRGKRKEISEFDRLWRRDRAELFNNVDSVEEGKDEGRAEIGEKKLEIQVERKETKEGMMKVREGVVEV